MLYIKPFFATIKSVVTHFFELFFTLKFPKNASLCSSPSWQMTQKNVLICKGNTVELVKSLKHR